MALKNIAIPDSVTIIEDYAFSGCEGLDAVLIGKNVETIENSAFRHCPNITDVYYPGTEAEWNEITIGKYNECITNATIHFNTSAIPDSQKTSTTYRFDEEGDLSLTIKLPQITVTDDTLLAIISFDGNLMKSVNFITGNNIDGDVQTTIPYCYMDNIKIFVLESDDNLKPLTATESIEIE